MYFSYIANESHSAYYLEAEIIGLNIKGTVVGKNSISQGTLISGSKEEVGDK